MINLSNKTVLTALAVFLFLQGMGATFLSREILAVFRWRQDELPDLLLKMLGALQLGWGMLNYMYRNHPFGGIFGRPLLLANLAILIASGMALVRAGSHSGGSFPALWIFASAYLVLASLILKIIRTDPPPIPKP